MYQEVFSSADILLPQSVSLTDWSVVACDQYTSEPQYWQRAAQRTQNLPSSRHLILPECFLNGPGMAEQIKSIHQTMQGYLESGLFCSLPDSFVYIERELSPGVLRRGLIGKVDLEAYDYTAESRSPIRPTEGTVESRLPSRIRVRQGAPLELPHLMLLADDPERSLIEPVGMHKEQLQPLYHFPLMENGGTLSGWRLTEQASGRVRSALHTLWARAQRRTDAESPLVFAVGDGNHSLAAAKACWEQVKPALTEEERKAHPMRYALAELVNLHDPALRFEPIHRVVTGVDPGRLYSMLLERCGAEQDGKKGGETFGWLAAGRLQTLTLPEPAQGIAVGRIQRFLDEALPVLGGEVDYIHGEAAVYRLCERPDAVGLLFSPIPKETLFCTVQRGGPLPRKTFSMGHAWEKRYYLEARCLQNKSKPE